MGSRLWAVALGVAVAAAGCGQSGQVTKCAPMSGPSPLVTGAKLLKLDLYPQSVGCVGDLVAPNAGAPVQSRSFHPGDAVNIDVPPGVYTILFTTYSDAAGTVELGTACRSATLTPGAQFCLDITVDPAPDLSVEDASVDLSVCSTAQCPCMADNDCLSPDRPRCGPGKVCVPCLPTNDNCPANQYCSQSLQCNTGCKESSDCSNPVGDLGFVDGGSGSATPYCDTGRHNCVQCLSSNDCTVGQLCSPSGACVLGCDLTMGKGCPGTLTCCNKLCVDTRSDPLNCSACAMPCTGVKTLCCNSVCADPTSEPANCGGCGLGCSTVNGTASCSTGKCSWACNPSFAHCMTGQNTGCETATTTLSDCGGCGNVCNGANANTTTCNGTTCQYACKNGFADCVTTAPDTNGCETNLAVSGEKLCGAACIPTASCCTTADCTTPPGPSACYTPSCTVATGACSYGQKTGSQVCGATCCLPINGTCNAGTCTLTCTGGFADCNGNPVDGCETNLAGAGLKLCGTQCIAAGSCCTSTDCASPPAPAACYNAAGTCSGAGGTCSYTQKTGSQICGATCCLPINGTCNAGTCTLNCSAGSGDCNGTPTDGCETNTNTSLTSCGGCGRACLTGAPVATAQCLGGLCTSTCSSGSGNCTQPAFPTADNGCETNTLTDANNCGLCARQCSAVHVGTRSCSGGTCNSTCSGVFANCSQPTQPTADNGCECAGNACCGGGTTCQTVHANGLGQQFFDCAALNTFNNAEALAACTAHTGNAALCSSFQCAPQSGTTVVDGVVCDNNGNGSTCHCWDYSIAGQTGIAPGSIDSTCLCPFTGETPNWN